MNDITEVFWEASVEEMKKGYIFDTKTQSYICLICGKHFEKGIIFNENGTFFEAEKYSSVHLENEHGGMFKSLIEFDKKYTGLTDNQKEMAISFYNGLSDEEIVEQIGNVTASTIRNYRFSLREKAKQAKIFLSIMEILEDKNPKRQKLIPIHRNATQIDERYNITEDENEKVLEKYFVDGVLTSFPIKEKRKITILRKIASFFERDKKYTEKEVNGIIKAVYSDYVTIRRYLIEYGFLDRIKDGSQYWVK